MVWTKDEVDKYVVQVERNCANAHEVRSCNFAYILPLSSILKDLQFPLRIFQRNLKGFAFARLYKEASDNMSAKRLVIFVSLTLPVFSFLTWQILTEASRKRSRLTQVVTQLLVIEF